MVFVRVEDVVERGQKEEEKLLHRGVDSCLIIPFRAVCPDCEARGAGQGELNHETCNQDFDPDGSRSGHFPRSHRRTGSRR
jgi:hypothetical protein